MKKYRIALQTYNTETTFPIDLTPSEVALFKEIENYLSQKNVDNWLTIKKEIPQAGSIK